LEGAATYLLLLTAVIVNAWYGGLYVGLASAAAEAIVAQRYLAVLNESTADATIRLALFLGVSVAVSIWAEYERRLKGSLKASTDRFRLLMDDITDYAIIVTDRNARVIDWNAGAEAIIGLRTPDRSCSLGIVFPVNEGDALDRELEIARKTGRADDERWHVRRDGSQFWAYGVLTSLRDSAGEIMGYVKILRDLTQRRIEQEERQRLTAELTKTNTVLRRMIAMLAHDLRAPLNAILGWASMVEDGTVHGPEPTKKALQAIKRSGRLQLDLIEELLDYSRIVAGKREESFEPLPLRELLEDALDTVRPAALSKSIHLEQLFHCGAATVLGNRTWLAQIFTNLLGNAVKFTPQQGRVRLECRQNDQWLEVQISDNGKGIPSHLLPRIFDPFERGTGREAGSGLGLTIVRELVEALGGRIRAESAGEGHGATFTVLLLPVTTVPASAEQHGPQHEL